MNHRMLLIDPDPSLTQQVSTWLTHEGFEITVMSDGESGLKKALNDPFDAIILDVILPKINGFDVLKSIRGHLDIPILILTARNDDIDRIIGYNLGADNYVLKPCNQLTLITHIRTLLRRSEKTPMHRSIIQYHYIKVDCAKRLVFIKEAPLELTNAEFNILETLIKSPNQAFSKEELTEYALGRKYTAYDRSIDVHISNLRNKLGSNPDGETWIKTVRGFGYMFDSNH